MSGRLEGLVALITGGARGNGLGISRVFLAEGAKICMVGRTQAWGDEAVGALRSISPDVMFVQGDVSEESDVQRSVEATVARFGSLHLAVNNAGGTTLAIGANACDTSLDDFRRAFRVNIDGPFLVSKYALPHMIEAGYGSIVNISSNAAIRASANSNVGYSSSKAALHGLTLTLAREYGPIVRCNELVIGHLHPSNPTPWSIDSWKRMKRRASRSK
jgi:3-oxoacyl-[acyl-carrier protein] reductase